LPELTLPLAAALRRELASPYAVAARAKGVGQRRLVWHHALPNALLPLLVSFTGLLPALVAGAVVVEVLFALPGMGRLLAEAASTQDYPVLIAGVLLTAGARLLALVAADLLQYRLDPRVRAALA
jgi:peptide/nickel transport system permease protein